MLKRIFFFLVLCLSMTLCTACSLNTYKYEKAQSLFASGEHDRAEEAFTALGSYEQSALYLTYIRTFRIAEDGQYELAISGFHTLDDFLDSRLQTIYYTARQAESEQCYEAAAESYKQIPTFRDSMTRLEAIPALIRQREYNAGIAPFLALDIDSLERKTDEELEGIFAICNQTLDFLSDPEYAKNDDPHATTCQELIDSILAEQDARITAQAIVLLQHVESISLSTASLEELVSAANICQEALSLLADLKTSNPSLQNTLTEHFDAIQNRQQIMTARWMIRDSETNQLKIICADNSEPVITWERALQLCKGVYALRGDEKSAVFHEDGRLVYLNGRISNMPSHFEADRTQAQDFILIHQNNQTSVCRLDGTQVLPPQECTGIEYLGQHNTTSYFCIYNGNKQALANDEGKVLTGFEWTDILPPHEGLFRVRRNGYYGYINTDGAEVIPCTWKLAYDFYNGRALVMENKYGGYIDHSGELAVPIIWSIPSDFSEGLASVYGFGNGKEYGFQYIDPDGNVVIRHSNALQSGGDFYDSFACVSDYDAIEHCLITKRGTIITSSCDAYRNEYPDTYLRIKKNGSWGLVDQSGRTVIPVQMDYIEIFPYTDSETNETKYMIFVDTGEEKGIFVPELASIIRCDAEPAITFNAYGYADGANPVFAEEQMISAVKDGLYGCINFRGETVIDYQYEEPLDFCNGFSIVRKAGRFGYIDTSGQEVIPCEWDWAKQIVNGFALVGKDSIMHVIDIDGQIFW